jgi:AraC family transcriptional regulator, transcriptional activator of pobA
MSKILETDPQFSLLEATDPDFYIKDLRDICFQKPIYSKYHLIILNISGGGKIKYDLSELELSKPSVYFFSPYQIIQIEDSEKLLGKVIFFSIDFYCIESNKFEISCNGPLFNNIMYYSNIILENNQINLFKNLITEMIQELEIKSPDKDILLSYLKLILLNSLRLKKESTENLYYSNEDKDFINKFQFELEKHFKSKHTIVYYANKLNLSQSALNSKLKRLLGKSFGKILRERIIFEAKRNLIGHDFKIQDIAFNLGYDDPFYFSRFFKKMTGVSPEKFKNVYFLKKSI